MYHNKLKLKCTNEYDMISEINFNNLKTDVSFGFNPKNVNYIGKTSKENLKKLFIKK